MPTFPPTSAHSLELGRCCTGMQRACSGTRAPPKRQWPPRAEIRIYDAVRAECHRQPSPAIAQQAQWRRWPRRRRVNCRGPARPAWPRRRAQPPRDGAARPLRATRTYFHPTRHTREVICHVKGWEVHAFPRADRTQIRPCCTRTAHTSPGLWRRPGKTMPPSDKVGSPQKSR